MSSSRSREYIVALSPAESAHLQEGFDYLLDEEGIPLGLPGDQGLQLFGEARGDHNPLCHLDAVLNGEGI